MPGLGGWQSFASRGLTPQVVPLTGALFKPLQWPKGCTKGSPKSFARAGVPLFSSCTSTPLVTLRPSRWPPSSPAAAQALPFALLMVGAPQG